MLKILLSYYVHDVVYFFFSNEKLSFFTHPFNALLVVQVHVIYWSNDIGLGTVICLIKASGAIASVNLIPQSFPTVMRIENRSVTKDIRPTLVPRDNIGSLKTIGGSFIIQGRHL